MNNTIKSFLEKNKFKEKTKIYYFTNGDIEIQYEEDADYVYINHNRYEAYEVEKYGDKILEHYSKKQHLDY